MTTERNRALRCAYGHARRGRAELADAWVEVAATFAAPTPKQLALVERLLRESGPYIHPGQLAMTA